MVIRNWYAIFIIFLFLTACSLPVSASSVKTYSVGMTCWDVNGVIMASITITVNPAQQEFSELTAEEVVNAKVALAVGNRLYYAESLRGKTVAMAVYMKKDLLFPVYQQYPEFIPSTVYVKNLYQDNQEIIGYQPYYSR